MFLGFLKQILSCFNMFSHMFIVFFMWFERFLLGDFMFAFTY